MKPIALLAVLAALAAAEHWDVERVDSAGWGAAVDMRWHPDGRLYLCYSDTSGIIRLASKDTIWSYEDLPQWRSTRSGTQGFDIDRRGNIDVSYVDTHGHCWCALKTDTGCADIQTPFLGYPFFPSLTTLDTAGSLAVTAQMGDAFILARLQGTEWVTLTLANGYSGWTNYFDCSALGSTDSTVWGVFRYTGSFPGEDASVSTLYQFQARDSDASVVEIAGGVGSSIWAASGCSDRQGFVHSAYTSGELYLDQVMIDPVTVNRTAVKFDSLNRPHIAYGTSDDTLIYRFRGAGVWHVFDLHTGGVTALSLAIDELSAPLIAYTTSEGVFLARGVNVVGQSEERGPAAFGSRMTATVVRGVLYLPDRPSTAVTALLDMTGRRVASLHSGANDVGRLVPGVYFLREAQAREVRKVILAR